MIKFVLLLCFFFSLHAEEIEVVPTPASESMDGQLDPMTLKKKILTPSNETSSNGKFESDSSVNIDPDVYSDKPLTP